LVKEIGVSARAAAAVRAKMLSVRFRHMAAAFPE